MNELYIRSVGFENAAISSLIKFRNQMIYPNRGCNVYLVDHNLDIKKQEKMDGMNPNEIYLVIFVIDGVTGTNVAEIGHMYKLKMIDQLKKGGSYYFIYDNKNKRVFDEAMSNVYLMEKTYEFKNDQLVNKKNFYVVCLSDRYMYFQDYLESFNNHLNFKLIILPNIGIFEYTNDPNCVYLFCQYIPEHIAFSHKNIFLISTEQLTIGQFMEIHKILLKAGIRIIEYCPENYNLLQHDAKMHYLPYQYRDTEIDKLRGLLANTPKTYDVVVVGHQPERRMAVLNKLRNMGVNIVHVSGWNDERDIEIAKGRILLNIHAQENRKMFESHRCDRWIFAGMFVLSEETLETGILDIRNLVVFEKYENLVNKTVEVLKYLQVYYDNFNIKHNLEIDNIRKNRSMECKKVMSVINS